MLDVSKKSNFLEMEKLAKRGVQQWGDRRREEQSV